MTYHPFTKWKRLFSVSRTTRQPVLTTSLLRLSSMMGVPLHRRLHIFILHCCLAKCLPQQLKISSIILVYSQKGDPAECGNDRGISLLSVPTKSWPLFLYIVKRVTLQNVETIVASLASPFSLCRQSSSHYHVRPFTGTCC